MISNFWGFVNGKKVVIGAVIAVITEIVNDLPILLPVFVSDANEVTRYVGLGVTVLGLIHKAYKYAYNEEVKVQHPTEAKTDAANLEDVKK